MRDAGDRRDVRHAHHRVGRRLEVHQPGFRPQRIAYLLRVRGVHEREGDAEPLEHVREHAVRAAVQVLLAHDVVAGREALEDRLDRGQAARERGAVAPALQRRDVRFQRLARRVLHTRVLVSAPRLAERVLHVRRRLVDGRHDCARCGVRRLPRVHRARAEPGLAFRHGRSVLPDVGRTRN